MDAEKYPESAKLLAVSKESQTCGELLEWLGSQGYVLCTIESDSNKFYPINRSIETLLAAFFEIDLGALDKEKAAALDEHRERMGI